MNNGSYDIIIEAIEDKNTKYIKKISTLIAGEKNKYPSARETHLEEVYVRQLINDPYSAGSYIMIDKKTVVGAFWLQKNIIKADKAPSNPEEISRITVYFSNRANSSSLSQQVAGHAAGEFLANNCSAQLSTAVIYPTIYLEKESEAMTYFILALEQYNGQVVTRAKMARQTNVTYDLTAEAPPQCQIMPSTPEHIQNLMKICWLSHKEIGDYDFMASMVSEELWTNNYFMNLETSRHFSFVPEASFTAIYDTQLVGGIWVVRPMYSIDTAFIMELFVDPKLQGRGIGTHLLQATLLAIQNLNTFKTIELCVSCHVSTPDYYKKFGFEILETNKEVGFPAS